MSVISLRTCSEWLPDEFDNVLAPFYERGVLDPRDGIELACNLAGALAEYDVSVEQAMRIIEEQNVQVVTPDKARRLAEVAVRFRQKEGPTPTSAPPQV